MTRAALQRAVPAPPCAAGDTHVALIVESDRAIDPAALAARGESRLGALFAAGALRTSLVADEAVEGAIAGCAAPIALAVGPRRFGLALHRDLADAASLALLARSILDPAQDGIAIDRLADDAAWRAGFATDPGEPAAAARGWWRARVHPPCGWPFARSDGAGTLVAREIPRSIDRGLVALAAARGWHPATPWLGIWWLALRAIADTPITIWTGFDGRGFEGLAACVGRLERHLPLAWPLEPGAGFAAALAAIDADLALAATRQEFAPDLPARGATGFRWRRALQCAGGGAGWRERMLHDPEPRLDLGLEIVAGEGGATLRLRGAIGDADAERLAALLLAIAQGVACDAERCWEAMLPAGPTAAAAAPAATRSILADIARWAAETPDAPAVVDAFDRLSFAQLWARAGAVAARLRSLGVAAERPVGLVAGRSVAVAVGMLGIWRAGAPYLPIDPAHPDARLRALLDAAGAVAIVADPPSGARAERWERPVVLVTDEERRETDPADAGHPAAAAYLIATSGSTGTPKLVTAEHRHLAAYRDGLIGALDPGDGRRYAMVTGWATDLGLTMVVAALTTGGSLHLLPAAALLQAPAFAAFVRGHDIEILKTTPGHLATLLAQPDGAAVLPSRLVMLGGEALPWPLVEAIARAAPRLAIWNHYGPTETTVGALAGRVRPDEVAAIEAPPLGIALPGLEVSVRDALGRPAADWVPGELWIAGPGVTRGYAGAPGATAAAFLPGRDGSRCYATGDRARRLADGRIVYLGRRDFQVKIAGYRVDPGEIESALRALPGIAGCTVVARRTAGGDPRLLAYVVPGEGAAADPAAWRRALAEILPPHALPAAFVTIPAIPLRDNGKPDHDRLPDEAAGRQAPLDALESRIAAIWEELLGIAEVGPDERFFDVGGHSLQMVALHQLLLERLGVEFTLLELFVHPTIGGIAALARGRARDDVAIAAARRGGRQRAALAGMGRLQKGGRRG